MQSLPLITIDPTEDEVIAQPAFYHGQPAWQLLTEEEQVSGCRLYQVHSPGPSLHLQAGDLVVARPVARNKWSIRDGDYYILNEQIDAVSDAAGFFKPAFKAEHLVRVISSEKKRSFLALFGSGNGDEEVIKYRYAALLELHRLTRLIRTL